MLGEEELEKGKKKNILLYFTLQLYLREVGTTYISDFNQIVLCAAFVPVCDIEISACAAFVLKLQRFV